MRTVIVLLKPIDYWIKHESFKLQTICNKIITLLIFETVLYKCIILLLQNQQHIIFHSVFVSNCEQCFFSGKLVGACAP